MLHVLRVCNINTEDGLIKVTCHDKAVVDDIQRILDQLSSILNDGLGAVNINELTSSKYLAVSVENKYYRGRFLGRKDTNVIVQLIDFDEIVNVPYYSIRFLDALQQNVLMVNSLFLPAQCFDCVLSGVLAIRRWNAEEKSRVNKIVRENHTTVEVVNEIYDKKILKIILQQTKDLKFVLINEHLAVSADNDQVTETIKTMINKQKQLFSNQQSQSTMGFQAADQRLNLDSNVSCMGPPPGIDTFNQTRFPLSVSQLYNTGQDILHTQSTLQQASLQQTQPSSHIIRSVTPHTLPPFSSQTLLQQSSQPLTQQVLHQQPSPIQLQQPPIQIQQSVPVQSQVFSLQPPQQPSTDLYAQSPLQPCIPAQSPITYVEYSQPPPAQYKNEPLRVGAFLEAFVVCVIDGPSCFAIQLTNDDVALRRMMAKLNDKSFSPERAKGALFPGAVCLANSTDKGVLCRGVVSAVKKRSIVVYFVDFGNQESVSFNDIYNIPPEFLSEKMMATRVSLAQLNNELLSTRCQNIFSNNVLNKSVIVKVTEPEEPCKQFVELFIIDNEKNVNVREKMIISYPKYTKIPLPPRGSINNVYISHIDGLSNFYVRMASHQKTLEKVMDTLAKCYETSGPDALVTMDDIVENMPVAALYSDDNKWYRAVIKEVPENAENISIFYVDFGNFDTV